MPTLLIELIIINNYFLIFLIVSTIGIFFSYIIYQEQRTARSTRDYQRLYAEVITAYEQGEPLKLTTNRAKRSALDIIFAHCQQKQSDPRVFILNNHLDKLLIKDLRINDNKI